MTKATPGPSSPLLKYEPEFVAVITQMARMRMALSPSECISLINSLIDRKQAQCDLISFKKKFKFGEEGRVGYGYWKLFKKRNEHLICTKRGQKYALDRDKWTTYANFCDMYTHVYTEMEDAGVAARLIKPAWQDEDGSPCDESSVFGCKVTHTLTHPELCFVMDEVGGNISQKGDGHMGGRLLVCEKGMDPQQTINTKDKHFTLLGLTALNGDPVMCICIFAGVRESAIVETGMDIFAKREGDVSDDDYLKKIG